MTSKKEVIEHRYDSRIHTLIKMCFASFKYKLHSCGYSAEFYDGPAPMPIYSDVECAKNGRFIKCKREGNNDNFFSWFVPAKKEKMPLLVVSPGYDAGLKSYPDVSDKYNLLFISPLGYSSPFGINTCVKRTWPLLYNTVCGFKGGYSDWLMDALTVIKFIEDNNLADTEKLIFTGTSNGGAMALSLASFYGERCMAVCADLPFLIGFSTRKLKDVIYQFPPPPDIRFRPSDAKKRLSIADPDCHASRLTVPVLLTSSDIDEDCPEEDITALFHKIPETTTKTYIKYKSRPHGYSSEFFEDMMNFLKKLNIQ